MKNKEELIAIAKRMHEGSASHEEVARFIREIKEEMVALNRVLSGGKE